MMRERPQLSRMPQSSPPVRRSSKPTRRTLIRRRIIVGGALLLGLAVIVGAGAYTANALTASMPLIKPVITMPSTAPEPAPRLDLPGFGGYAIAAEGYDAPLASGNPDKPMPMASITKIITSLVVLDKYPISASEQGPEITYTEQDVAIYQDQVAQNGSVAPVVAGSKLSLRQSLEAMLLPSGNNYAVSITNWAFGGTDAFLTTARSWLAIHGLKSTTIVDSHGLSDSNTSTPAELTKLGEVALKNPTVAAIVALPSDDLPSIGKINNSNKLLGQYGVDGIKTGSTDTAANLLFSAELPVGTQKVTLVGVLLGGVDHATVNSAVAALLSSVTPGFREIPVLAQGQIVATYKTAWGQQTRARVQSAANLVVWGNTPVQVSVTVRPIQLATKATEVGTVTATAGGPKVSVPVALDTTLTDPGPWWRLTNPEALSR